MGLQEGTQVLIAGLIGALSDRTGRRVVYVGGLVFTVLSDLYLLQRYGSLGSSPARLMHKTFFGTKATPDEEVGCPACTTLIASTHIQST